MPEEEQERFALEIREHLHGIHKREGQEKINYTFTRPSEASFSDWDNEKDAAYDNWLEHYGV